MTYEHASALHVLVMGVSGCGKSTVGVHLASEISAEFLDADDLHSPPNLAKMRRGEPLDDNDRAPWLREVGSALASRRRVVVACSALRRRYRDVLREFCPTLQIVHLTGSPELLLSRMEARSDHFMPPALLWSQLTALEVPSVDETAFEANVEQSPASIAAAASVWLRRSI